MASTRAADSPSPRRLRPAPDPPREPRPFGPGSFMWDDMGDVLFLSLASGAFVLQVMHPVIAAGVDRHSTFRTDPLGRAVRSLDSMMLWVYGGQAAVEEGERLRVLHRPVHGTTDEGEHYSALDPEAYAWVHGTAFVTAVRIAPYVRGRAMTPAEEAQAYEEHLQLGELLRVPAKELPQSIPDYWDYYRTMVHDRLRRTAVAEELCTSITSPRIRVVPGPVDLAGWTLSRGAGHAGRLLTYASMTDDVRAVLGVRWTSADEAQLRALFAVARPVHARLPERLRYVPLALHARRHARELEAIHRRARMSLV